MLKRFLEDLVEGYEGSKRFVAGGRNLGGSVVILNKYNVFVSDDACIANLKVSTRLPAVGCSGILIDGEVLGGYICNKRFLEMSEEFQTCAMIHEECHILNGDWKRKITLKSTFERFFYEPLHEKYADVYAYTMLGERYLDFLNSMVNVGYPSRPVYKRVRYLLDLLKKGYIRHDDRVIE